AGGRGAPRGGAGLGRRRVRSARESCGGAPLGGQVARGETGACGHTVIAYNSCRNRHCVKCQGAAAREWLTEREADLLPVPYFHVVFSLPAEIGDVAYQNKAGIYDLLFKVSAETMLTIAADPEHLGARIAITSVLRTSVLHTWGSAMMHHPHVHMIVPGGGISPDGTRWIAAKPRFLVPVLVLSALFRRRMLEALGLAHKAGKLVFFNNLAPLADAATFADYLEPLKEKKWHVYAKRPFAGPKAVLAYLARYTHRVAISNRRLISADANGVTFKYKDYRIDGPSRYKRMTVHTHEFIRRFLIHVLPKGLHRTPHYGPLANGQRAESLAKSRVLLRVNTIDPADELRCPSIGNPADAPHVLHRPCPCCGARMLIIETFEGICRPRATSSVPVSGPRVDTS